MDYLNIKHHGQYYLKAFSRGRRCGSVVECWPNMLEALGVIPNTPYKTNGTEQRGKEEKEENYYWGK